MGIVDKMDYLKFPIVTGAGGFIGYHMCKFLSSLDTVEKVIAIDLESSRNFGLLSDLPKVKAIALNLLNPIAITSEFEKSSVVFAFAARNGTSLFYKEPYRVLRESSLPILNTISAFANICPIIYSSSSEVYAASVARGFTGVPTAEDAIISIGEITNTRWSYATAKILGEVAMYAAREELGLRGSIVRYHNVYGPRMGLDHFIPDFLERASRGTYQLENPESTRSFLYISDAINGTIATLQSNLSLVPIFHLGTQDEMTIRDASQLILRELGLTDEINIQELMGPNGSVNRRAPDCRKAQIELNWAPKVTLSEGIRSLIKEGWR